MANVKIDAWDIAEALGLRYVKEEYDEYHSQCVHKYDFHGKEIVDACWRSDTADSKEGIAQDLLREIGKSLSKIIGEI